MVRDTKPTPANPKKILVDWANSQQNWVRAVVAEILDTRESPSEATLDAFYEQSLTERGLRQGTVTEVPKLRFENTDGDTAEELVLTLIKDVSGVNILAPDQELIFNKRMTVIFGENASGKSGYVRVLKRVAGVRSAERVLPNIRLARPGSPHATLGYNLGGSAHSLAWNNETGILPFTRIGIFDTRAVSFHLDQDLEYVYVPRDLALFPLVRDSIQAIKDRLTHARDEARPSANPFLTHFDRNASIYGRLESLGASTNFDDLQALAAVKPEEAEQVQALRERVDALRPQAISSQLQAVRGDKGTIERLRSAATTGKDFKWKDYDDCLSRIAAASAKHRAVTEQAFADTSLPGVLTDSWRDFILAGEAHLEHLERLDYPAAADHCLYCDQKLGAAATVLVRKYRDYATNTHRLEVEKGRRDLQTLAAALLALDLKSLDEQSVAPKSAAPREEGTASPVFVKGHAFLQRLLVLQGKVKTSEPVEPADLVTVAAEVVQLSEAALAQADTLIADLTKRGEERTRAYDQAKKELRELEARITLQRLLPQIRDYINRAKWANQADTIISGPLPALQRSLTEASKVASEDLMNQDFTRFFERECQALQAPQVKLEFPGRGAQAKRKKLLTSAYKLSDILSEGEQKVIAIADFLAETAIRTTAAPLVFDDPVNSLDYKRLQYIVARIYELSGSQQVIVFTHNIWFAMALLGKFERSAEQCSFYDVSRGEGDIAGLVHGGTHPRYDTPSKLKGRINERLQAAGSATGETRQALVESCYSLMRSWCETVVEQEVLGGVTQRYQPNVMMGNLTKIHPERLQTAISGVSTLFDKCCRITEAHSQPLETLNVRVSLEEARQDWASAQATRDSYLAVSLPLEATIRPTDYPLGKGTDQGGQKKD